MGVSLLAAVLDSVDMIDRVGEPVMWAMAERDSRCRCAMVILISGGVDGCPSGTPMAPARDKVTLTE